MLSHPRCVSHQVVNFTPSETIGRINWTVYGKIKGLTKGAGINYGYDAGGNRITKKVGDNYTFYIRDAQGNVLGIYEKNNTNFSWAEQQLYGSSVWVQ